MLTLLIPALLGMALVTDWFSSDRDDDDDDIIEQSPDLGPQTGDPQNVSDGYVGTNAAESLQLDGNGGVVDGAGGNDTISGSQTQDGIIGGSGDDVIYARGGDDGVIGGEGNDTVFLGDGQDVYSTFEDGDTSDAGDDFVRGGNGDDLITDLRGSNTLRGDLGDDVLISFDGLGEDGVYDAPEERGTPDKLIGGFGDDLLAGDDGDTMTGGEGEDLFFVTDDDELEGEDRLEEVQINDFNTLEDALLIVNVNNNLDGEVTFEYDADLDAVRASFDGRSIAVLKGLAAADIPNIEVATSGWNIA